MLNQNNIANLPLEILRTVFMFLDVADIFNTISSCRELLAVAETPTESKIQFEELLSNSMISNQPNHKIVFNMLWRNAGTLAIKRWDQLFGPFQKIILTADLTSLFSNPENSSFIFNHLKSRYQNFPSLTVHLPCDYKTTNTTNNQYDEKQQISIEHSLDLIQHPLKLQHLCLTLSNYLKWRHEPNPYFLMNNWLQYLLQTIHLSSLQSLHISVHITTLLWENQQRFASQPLLLQLPNLQEYRLSTSFSMNSYHQHEYNVLNTTSKIPSTFWNKIEFGVRHILKGPNALTVHQRFFSLFLLPILLGSQQLHELNVVCVVPEAFQAFRDCINDNRLQIQRISTVKITAHVLPLIDANTKPKELIFHRCLQKEFQQLTTCMKNLGFILNQMNDCLHNNIIQHNFVYINHHNEF